MVGNPLTCCAGWCPTDTRVPSRAESLWNLAMIMPGHCKPGVAQRIHGTACSESFPACCRSHGRGEQGGMACLLFARMRLAMPPGDTSTRAIGPVATRQEVCKLAEYTGQTETQIRDALTNYRARRCGYADDLHVALLALRDLPTASIAPVA